MLAIGGKDPNILVATAKSSYSFFYTYVYTNSPAARALYKAYNNPNIIQDLGTNLIGNAQLDKLGKKFVA